MSRAANYPRYQLQLSSLVFQNCFPIDGDIDFISDYDAAAIHHVLPANAKILTIDLSSSHETRARLWSLVNSIFPPGSLPLSQVVDIQTGRARNSADCQITCDREVMLAFYLNLIALEGDLGMMLDIKKVRAA